MIVATNVADTPCLAERQRLAREAFDLDAAMAALPPAGPQAVPTISHRGQAGVRLRGYLVADISDELLRHFANDTLGAKRCSEQYLDALRVVLGNQADAERYGYVLEMNSRVPFAAEQTMRTIISQMQEAGLTFGKVVGLGKGRTQLVQCYANSSEKCGTAADQLNAMARRDEDEDDKRREQAIRLGTHPHASTACPTVYLSINRSDVPY